MDPLGLVCVWKKRSIGALSQQSPRRLIDGVAPARAAMFEDLTRNLEVPHRLGMRTVLVVPQGTREVFREAWELERDDAPHVEFVTDDLPRFVSAVAGALNSI